MTGAAELCNGERAVVFLFVSGVLYSSPLSLSYEAAALCLLAVAGLVIEISAESSTALDRFKTRPGASSGIQLGAVTLPTVMLSRLIQLSRALLRQDVGPEELAYMSMQYWTVSISCFGVLIFICLLLRRSPNGASFFHLGSSQASKYSLLHTVLYALTCYLSFATKSDGGWFVTKNLLWLLCHGLVTVFLIQYILRTFPSCASIAIRCLSHTNVLRFLGV